VRLDEGPGWSFGAFLGRVAANRQCRGHHLRGTDDEVGHTKSPPRSSGSRRTTGATGGNSLARGDPADKQLRAGGGGRPERQFFGEKCNSWDCPSTSVTFAPGEAGCADDTNADFRSFEIPHYHDWRNRRPWRQDGGREPNRWLQSESFRDKDTSQGIRAPIGSWHGTRARSLNKGPPSRELTGLTTKIALPPPSFRIPLSSLGSRTTAGTVPGRTTSACARSPRTVAVGT
jgi:hypothetical protein